MLPPSRPVRRRIAAASLLPLTCLVFTGLVVDLKTPDPSRSSAQPDRGSSADTRIDESSEPPAFFLSNGSFENDLTGWTPVGNVTVATGMAHSGSRSLFVTDDAAAAFSYVYQSLNLTFGTDKIEFWVYPETATYRTHFGLITGWQTASGEYQTHVQFQDTHTVFVVAGVAETVGAVLAPNMWNQIRIYVSQSTRTQQLLINDELVSEITVEEDFDMTEHLLVGDLSGPADYGTVYFDDISITGSGTISDPVLVAVDDRFVDNGPGPKFLPVLNNDLVPVGVQVEISVDTPPQFGEILSVEADGVWYERNDGLEGTDQFSYSLMALGKDGRSVASSPAISETQKAICFCVSLFTGIPPDECLFVPGGNDGSGKLSGLTSALFARALDLDLTLLIRGRDAMLAETETGAAFIEALMFNSPEILQEVVSRPELMPEIITMFEFLEGPIRSLLDGDGSETISQESMDAVEDFLTDVATFVSDELRATLDEHMTALGPFDQYVGMSVADAYAALGETTDIDPESTIPTDFVLEQNFPNPFETTTHIRYTLSRRTPVSVQIFDVQGRRVLTLLDTVQDQGRWSLEWDGRDEAGNAAASGIYLFRLQTASGHLSGSMVLSR